MKNNKKGFTLVELVIVVAVMAILVAVAIPTVGAITGSARTSVNNTNAQTIESMIKLAEAEGAKTTTGATNATICQIIIEARLGIDEGEFVYNPATGNVTYAAASTATDDDITIVFNKTAQTVTVDGGVGDAATESLTEDFATEAPGA